MKNVNQPPQKVSSLYLNLTYYRTLLLFLLLSAGFCNMNLNAQPTACFSANNTIITCDNQSAQLTVDFTGTAPFTFDYTDGTNTISTSGITSNPYTFSVSAGAAVQYTLLTMSDVNTNGSICLNTPDFYVQSYRDPAASLSGSQTICNGHLAELTINYTGPISWAIDYTDGTSNFTVSGLYTFTVSPSVNTTYTLTSVSALGGTCIENGLNSSIIVDVTPTLSGTISGNQTICSGSTARLTYSFTGASPWSMLYTDGTITNGSISGLTSSPYYRDVTPTSTTTYSLRQVSNPYCNFTYNPTLKVVVTVNPIPTATISMNGTMCPNTPTALTFTLTGSPPWEIVYSEGTTPSRITGITSSPYNHTVTPAITTFYTFDSVYDANCSAYIGTSAYIRVPDVETILNYSNVCAGGFTFFTSTWTGPYLTPWDLSYSDGTSVITESGITSGSYNFTVTPSISTTYTIISAVNSLCSANLTNTHFVVTVLPRPIGSLSGTQTICQGASTNLTFNLAVGTSWNFSYSTGTTSIIITGVSSSPYILNITPLSNTTYYFVKIYGSNGCNTTGGNVDTAYVTLHNPTPSIAFAPACAGSTLNLSAIGTLPGSTYYWEGPDNFSSNLQDPVISNAQSVNAGYYTLTVTDPYCGLLSPVFSTQVIISLDISGVGISSNAPICATQNLHLSATSVPGAVYAWSGPNGFTSTVLNPDIIGAVTANSGIYTLVVSSSVCGTSNTITSNITVNSSPTINAGYNGPICQGNYLQLSVNNVTGASSYTWTGPATYTYTSTSQNPGISNAQPNRTGVYTLVVNTSSCGTLTTTVSVQVGATLTSFSGTSNTPVCVGNSITLSANNTYIQGVQFSWTGPNSFTSSDQFPAAITPAQTIHGGTYVLNLHSNHSCGSDRNINVVVVIKDSSLVAAGTNGPLCTGNALYLTATGPTGSTYSWIAFDGYSSSTQNPSRSNMTTAMSGTYSMTATVQGCGAVSRVFAITIYPSYQNPTATSNSTLCAGQTLNLTANNSGNNDNLTFSWVGPNGFTANTIQPSLSNVTTADAGIYTVSIYSTCFTPNPAVRTTTVLINSLSSLSANLTPGTICIGSPMYFAGTGPTGTTAYSWSGPGGYTSSSQNPTRTAQSGYAGIYTLTANVPGCGTISTTVTASITCRQGSPGSTPENEITESPADQKNTDFTFKTELIKLSVYPNPNSGNSLKLLLTGLQNDDAVKYIQIYDSKAQLIYAVSPENNNSELKDFDLNFRQPLSTGVYWVEVQTQNERLREMFIVN